MTTPETMTDAELLTDAKAAYLRAWETVASDGKAHVAAAAALLAACRRVRNTELDGFIDVAEMGRRSDRMARGDNAVLAKAVALQHAGELSEPGGRFENVRPAPAWLKGRSAWDDYLDAQAPFTWLAMIYEHAVDRDEEMRRAKLRGELDGIAAGIVHGDRAAGIIGRNKALIAVAIVIACFALGAWLAS